MPYEAIRNISRDGDTDGLFFPFSLREESIHKTLADCLKRLGDSALRTTEKPDFEFRAHEGADRPIHSRDGAWKKGSHIRIFDGTPETSPDAQRKLVEGLLAGVEGNNFFMPGLEAELPEVKGGLRPIVERSVLVEQKRSKTAFPLLKARTLKAARFSGVESGVSAAGAVILELIAASDVAVPDGGDSNASKTLARLAKALRSPGNDILSVLTDALISRDEFPPLDGVTELSYPAPQQGRGSPRRILHLAPTLRLERDVNLLVDALEESVVHRDTFYRMFCDLATLRLAQYLGEISQLTALFAARLRKVVREKYAENLAEADFFEAERIRTEIRLPFTLGAHLDETVLQPLSGHLRNMKLILLARIRAGQIAEGNLAANLNEPGWNLEAAKELLRVIVKKRENGLTEEDLDAHDRGETIGGGKTRFDTTMNALTKQIFVTRQGVRRRIEPTDDLLHALALVEIRSEPGRSRLRYDEFLANLRAGGIFVPGDRREDLAQRLMTMGLLNEMPDAEKFREITLQSHV